MVFYKRNKFFLIFGCPLETLETFLKLFLNTRTELQSNLPFDMSQIR